MDCYPPPFRGKGGSDRLLFERDKTWASGWCTEEKKKPVAGLSAGEKKGSRRALVVVRHLRSLPERGGEARKRERGAVAERGKEGREKEQGNWTRSPTSLLPRLKRRRGGAVHLPVWGGGDHEGQGKGSERKRSMLFGHERKKPALPVSRKREKGREGEDTAYHHCYVQHSPRLKKKREADSCSPPGGRKEKRKKGQWGKIQLAHTGNSLSWAYTFQRERKTKDEEKKI